MKRSKFTEAQIAFVLRQGDEGTAIGEVCRKAGISEATYYNWRKKYGGLLPSEMKRLRQLERAASLHHRRSPGELPAPADPASALGAGEGHRIDVLRVGLEIVEPCRRAHRVAERLVLGHIGDALAVYVDVASIAQAFDVVPTVAYRKHHASIRWANSLGQARYEARCGEMTITQGKRRPRRRGGDRRWPAPARPVPVIDTSS
jgi:putative transposase